jgi:Ca-activated chloride channel homolog
MRFFLLFSLTVPGAFAFQAGVDAKVNITPRMIETRPAPDAPDVHMTDAHLRVDTSLVVIPAFATTERGTTLTGLKRDNFRLFEDNVEQPVTYFATDDAPVSIGLVFDSSGSMHTKMQKSLEAVAEFLKTANREDEFFLIDFNERPKLTVPFTTNPDEIYERASRTKVYGRTSLYDAVHIALKEMKNAKFPRKAIVVFSDGGDNRSRYTFREIKADLSESDVQLYTVGIFDSDSSHKLSAEEKAGPGVLAQLSDDSGGVFFPVDNINDLPTVSAQIGNQLRNQYLLGFSPAELIRDGKFHKVRVDLVPPAGLSKLRVFYRRGYRSPAE